MVAVFGERKITVPHRPIMIISARFALRVFEFSVSRRRRRNERRIGAKSFYDFRDEIFEKFKISLAVFVAPRRALLLYFVIARNQTERGVMPYSR